MFQNEKLSQEPPSPWVMPMPQPRPFGRRKPPPNSARNTGLIYPQGCIPQYHVHKHNTLGTLPALRRLATYEHYLAQDTVPPTGMPKGKFGKAASRHAFTLHFERRLASFLLTPCGPQICDLLVSASRATLASRRLASGSWKSSVLASGSSTSCKRCALRTANDQLMIPSEQCRRIATGVGSPRMCR